MKKKLFLLTVTMLLVFGVAQVSLATDIGWSKDGPQMQKSDKWINPVEQLNLSEEQITKMREIKQNTYSQTRDPKIKLMDTKHELRMLQLQKNPDQAKIDAKKKEVEDMRSKIFNIKKQSKDQYRSLLTEEQLKQLDNKKKEKSSGQRQ